MAKDPLRQLEWAAMSPKERRKSKRYKNKYDLDLGDVKELAKNQDNACEICKNQIKLVVDRDHQSGDYRSLLCTNCNVLLGMAYEDIAILKSAIDYLTKYNK